MVNVVHILTVAGAALALSACGSSKSPEIVENTEPVFPAGETGQNEALRMFLDMCVFSNDGNGPAMFSKLEQSGYGVAKEPSPFDASNRRRGYSRVTDRAGYELRRNGGHALAYMAKTYSPALRDESLGCPIFVVLEDTSRRREPLQFECRIRFNPTCQPQIPGEPRVSMQQTLSEHPDIALISERAIRNDSRAIDALRDVRYEASTPHGPVSITVLLGDRGNVSLASKRTPEHGNINDLKSEREFALENTITAITDRYVTREIERDEFIRRLDGYRNPDPHVQSELGTEGMSRIRARIKKAKKAR